jgi:hypothetical protein
MTLSLAEMRAAMEKGSSQNNNNQTGNNDIFRFGDLKPGDEIRIRFVEDADPSNGFFWRERHSRSLKFDSLLLPNGTTMIKDTYVSVPAFNLKSNENSLDNLPAEYLYKSTEDVIQQKIKGLWIDGDKTSQALYNKFGKKVTYLFQGFIHSPGYEMKLYRFLINKDLFNLIKTFMTDSEIDDVPCSVQNGRDFILKVSEKSAVINGVNKTVKDYVTQSKWSSRVTPLTEQEIAYIQQNGAFDLKKFLPKRPSPEQEQVMLEMYNASYDGLPYDIKNWASTFRPDNIRLDQDGNVKLKEGEATSRLGTEIPQQVNVTETTYPPQFRTMPYQQQQYNPSAAGEQAFIQEHYVQPTQAQVVQASSTQPNWNGYNAPENRQMLVDSPVQVQQPTAPQIIKENVEQVQGNTAQDTVASIMAKLNMNN